MLTGLLKVMLVLGVTLLVNLVLGLGIRSIIKHMETNPYGSRTIMYSVLYVSMLGHIYLYAAGLPKLFIFYSFSIHMALSWLYEECPHMRIKDPRFIMSTLGTILSHFVLTRIMMDMDACFIVIAASYAIIWASPVMCFFSLSATDEILSFETRRPSRILGYLTDRLHGLQHKSDRKS